MADVELLPCSVEHELRVDAALIRNGIDGVRGPINREALADRLDRYANAAAELTAEIEALRSEVAAWRELSDHVRVGACAAIWPDRYTDARTRDVAAALKRAARMEEALEEIRSRSTINLAMRSDTFELTALLGDIHQIAGAALSKENKA